MKKESVIFVFSYHHMNTKKIADVISKILNSSIIEINKNDYYEIDGYDLLGFGSGIDSGRHYPEMISFAGKLPNVQNKSAFIFSTSAIYSDTKMLSDHKALRDILKNKGFDIIKEFSCKGFNTNSFLKYIGGMNRGRPNNEDFNNAKIFAESIMNL